MLKNLIIFFLFLLITTYNEDEILRIPLITHSEVCFNSKYGPIFYYFDRYDLDYIGFFNPSYIDYKFDNIKNLELLDSNFSNKINIDPEKNIAKITFEDILERDMHNKNICELFYQTKYINKKIFSLGKNLENEAYKYFGGTPKEIIEHTNKYTFNLNNNTISEIKIIFNNKNKDVIKIKPTRNNKVEFIDESYLICLTPEILDEFKKLFLNKYEQYTYTESNYEIKCRFKYKVYKLISDQIKTIPEIKFKIGNITISLNKDDLVYKIYEGEGLSFKILELLFIQNTPCDNITFGFKFLEKFLLREYDLENNEFNLYLDKNKNLLSKENKTNLKFNSYSDTSLTFVILLFMVSSTIFIYFINYKKFKNNEYLNYCEI